MDVLEILRRQILCESRWDNLRGYTLSCTKVHSSRTICETEGRTNVSRISFLRGLLEAKTILFPSNFFITGVFSACGRRWLLVEDMAGQVDQSTAQLELPIM
jgi:hypothetical protein